MQRGSISSPKYSQASKKRFLKSTWGIGAIRLDPNCKGFAPWRIGKHSAFCFIWWSMWMKSPYLRRGNMVSKSKRDGIQTTECHLGRIIMQSWWASLSSYMGIVLLMTVYNILNRTGNAWNLVSAISLIYSLLYNCTSIVQDVGCSRTS